jgi:phage gpG-like protein
MEESARIMSLGVDIDIDVDIKEALLRLNTMKLRSKNFTPLFMYAKKMLELANAENFTTGGLPVGGWAPRSDSKSYTHPPLVGPSGKLMRSLTSLFGPPNVITPRSATFGTNVEYAKFHQYGTTKMPARKIIFEPRGFGEDLSRKAANYVANGLIL